MNRLRFQDYRLSSGPESIGLCQTDTVRCAEAANTAQSRLLNCKEAGDEGWWGTWAEMAFLVSPAFPYLTTPRGVARIEAVSAGGAPIPVHNQFYEYLDFGNGRLPKQWAQTVGCNQFPMGAFARNTAPTFRDIATPPQTIGIFATDARDVTEGKRVLIQGLDANNAVLRSDDASGLRVQGQWLTLQAPFAVLPSMMNSITGIQKDITYGDVQIVSIDPATGDQVTLLTMEPGEEVAGYRRYYFHRLPPSLDASVDPTQSVTLTAICKLDPIPVKVDSDYLLLQGDGALEAIIEETQAKRYSIMDTAIAKQMARERHGSAVGFLNGVLNHYLGKKGVAVNFKPFGSARFDRTGAGMI